VATDLLDGKGDCLGARRERGGVGVVTLRPAHMSHFASLDEFCRPDGVGEAKAGVVWAVPVPACVTGGEEHVLLRFAVTGEDPDIPGLPERGVDRLRGFMMCPPLWPKSGLLSRRLGRRAGDEGDGGDPRRLEHDPRLLAQEVDVVKAQVVLKRARRLGVGDVGVYRCCGSGDCPEGGHGAGDVKPRSVARRADRHVALHLRLGGEYALLSRIVRFRFAPPVRETS